MHAACHVLDKRLPAFAAQVAIVPEVLYLYRFTEGSMQRSTDFSASRRGNLTFQHRPLPSLSLPRRIERRRGGTPEEH